MTFVTTTPGPQSQLFAFLGGHPDAISTNPERSADANGNTLTSGGLSYVYDAWNRLVSVSNTSTDAAVASYSYDALGRRITESYAGGSTNNLYYNANWKVIEQRQGGIAFGDVQYQYVYGATGNLILRDSYSDGSVEPSDRLYALTDANGDITALTNTSGTVVERYEYSPYGVVTVLTASGSPVSGNVSAYGWQYLFQGGRQDSATGLHIFEHRDYDPNSGTWMERDPEGLAAGDENLYRFVTNNPIVMSDPTGLCGDEPPEPPSKHLPGVEYDIAMLNYLRNGYVKTIYTELLEMYKRYPYVNVSGSSTPVRLDPDNLPQALKDEAMVIANAYFNAVVKFLKAHPDATPGYWTFAWARTDDSPDCDNWKTAIRWEFKGNNKWEYFQFREANFLNWFTRYEHQMVIVAPLAYPLETATPNTLDPIPVLFDPWPTATPIVSPLQTNSSGQSPTTIHPF